MNQKLRCAVLFVTCLSACGNSLSDLERSQLRDCAETLPLLTDVRDSLRLDFFLDGCGNALGFDKITRAPPAEKAMLLSETDIICNAKVGRAVAPLPLEAKWQRAAEMCSPGYYGLGEDQSNYMSLKWFGIQRVGSWIRTTLKKADKDKNANLIQQVKTGLASFRISLFPIPSIHKLQLPSALRANGHTASTVYAVVTSNNATVYTVPYVTLATDGKAVLHEHSTQPAEGDTILQIAKQKISTPKKKEKTTSKEDRKISQPSAPILLLADQHIPAQRVLAITERLSDFGVHLAVQPSSLTDLHFGSVQGTNMKVKNLRAFVSLNDDHIAVWKNGNLFTITNLSPGSGSNHLNELSRGQFCPVAAESPKDVAGSACNAGYDWDTLFEHLGTTDDPEGVLLVSAQGKASYEALIKLFEIASLANFELATTGISQQDFIAQNAPPPPGLSD